MKKIFIEDIGMETQTLFKKDGSIDINPCSFELGQHILSGASIASMKGRMVVEDSGASRFRPFATGTGSRYHLLYRSDFGVIKVTRNDLIFVQRLPKKLGKQLIEELFRQETEAQRAFIMSRETTTVWNNYNPSKA